MQYFEGLAMHFLYMLNKSSVLNRYLFDQKLLLNRLSFNILVDYILLQPILIVPSVLKKLVYIH